jgi:hypothetical protein
MLANKSRIRVYHFETEKEEVMMTFISLRMYRYSTHSIYQPQYGISLRLANKVSFL